VQCPEVVERLPELLNGTLVAAEREAVRSHLASCRGCGREWEETRLAAAVFGSHLPSDVIIALAWDRAGSETDAQLARQHLASCPECSEELALARESRKREAAPPPWPARSRKRLAPVFVPAALAAGLAVIAFGGGAFWERARQHDRLAAAESGRRDAIERLAAARSSEQTEARLRAELTQLAAPQVNLPILELLPGSTPTRDSAPRESEIFVGPQDRFVVLLLAASESGPGADVELRDGKGTVLWRGHGLRPSRLGGYTLGVPASLLPDGYVTMALSGPSGRPLATARFRVRRAR
jgi:hypothetical protein